jgi:uncharacterized membrane protein (DUF2068 family)
MQPDRARVAGAVGVRLIVAYKGAKAVAELALLVVLVVLAASGELAALRHLATQLREHLASRWSVLAGRAIGALVSEWSIHLIEIGLALDGLLSAVEAFSLWRGYRWAPWLVVIATASPLPLEIAEVVRTARPSRAGLVMVNLAVVAYLARLLAKERRPRPESSGS